MVGEKKKIPKTQLQTNQPTSKASLTSDRLLNLHPSVGWFEVDSLTILSYPTSKVVVYYPRNPKHSTKFLAQIKRWSIGGLGPGGLGPGGLGF